MQGLQHNLSRNLQAEAVYTNAPKLPSTQPCVTLKRKILGNPLGGSWDLVSKVISTCIGVISCKCRYLNCNPTVTKSHDLSTTLLTPRHSSTAVHSWGFDLFLCILPTGLFTRSGGLGICGFRVQGLGSSVCLGFMGTDSRISIVVEVR